MAKRMSDTAGLSGPCMPANESYSSKSIRKIDNGYIVSETKSRDGEYSSSERFMKSPDGRGTNVGQEGLSGAITECNK